MPNLSNSPAEILTKCLIDLAVGTLPTTNGSWPIYYSHEPNTPDNAITVYDTTSKIDGRAMPTGEVYEHFGLLFRVRSARFQPGYVKAYTLATALSETIRQTEVVIDANTFLIHSVSRVSGPIHIGRETPGSVRELFTLNVIIALTQLD